MTKVVAQNTVTLLPIMNDKEVTINIISDIVNYIKDKGPFPLDEQCCYKTAELNRRNTHLRMRLDCMGSGGRGDCRTFVCTAPSGCAMRSRWRAPFVSPRPPDRAYWAPRYPSTSDSVLTWKQNNFKPFSYECELGCGIYSKDFARQ